MKLVVHVGILKTATSSLQTACAKNVGAISAAGVIYVGPDDIRGRGFWRDFFGNYRRLAPEFNVAEFRSYLLGRLRKQGSGESDTIFLSEEGLSYDIMPNPQMPSGFGRVRNTCRFLQSLGMDDIHVVLTIRRQDRFLLSAYKHMVQLRGETETFGGWLFNNIDLDAVSWLPVIEAFEESIGVERLTVLPFEMTNEDGFAAYLQAVVAPAGLDTSDWQPGCVANPSLTDGSVDLARRVNETVPAVNKASRINFAIANSGALGQLGNQSIRRSYDVLTERLAARYADDNKAVRARCFPEVGAGFCFDG
jgi:hypothetical protein